jgi:hypothetical protein
LWGLNVSEVDAGEASLFVAGTLVLCIAVFFIFRTLFKDQGKAALLTAVLILLFFSYGQMFEYVQGWKVGIFSSPTGEWVIDWTIGRARYLLGFVLLILAALCIWMARIKSLSWKYLQLINVIALVLVVVPIYQISSYHLVTKKQWLQEANKDFGVVSGNKAELPDIYYIMPDGHARSDILKDYFDHDATDFTKSLEQEGFYIADKSRSNYSLTILSLASTLNTEYINYLIPELGSDAKDLTRLYQMILHNKTFETVKKAGYTWITFDQDLPSRMKETTDVLLSNGSYSSEFYNLLYSTTPLRIFIKPTNSASPFNVRRSNTEFIFDKLKEIPDIKGPTFTFAHIFSPHRPFVFDSEGNLPPQDGGSSNWGLHGKTKNDIKTNQRLYSEQVEYLDRSIMETVQTILKKSKKPPIIIIQSDHGARDRILYYDKQKGYDRDTVTDTLYMANFAAYYLPGFDQHKLYNTMTPVNAFRLMLNHYFDAGIAPVEDKSYYSGSKPLQMREIKASR